jgi:phage head maturation protease
MSIGFYVRSETWNAQRNERTLGDIELVEISAVGPAVAYSGTSISARSHLRPDASNVAPAHHFSRQRRRLAGL